MAADTPGHDGARGGPVTLSDLTFPLVIGHRGAAAAAPENTLVGFRLAKAMGCAWVEFDVRLAADGALVICHDERLDRTTNGTGLVGKTPLAVINSLDAGSWFGERFAGERVPTLDRLLTLCRDLDLGANVEIKAERGRGPATAAAVAECFDQLAGSLPTILVSSFLPDAVAEMAECAPAVPRGMLFRKVPRDWRGIAERLGCATINADQLYLTESIVHAVRSAGYPLLSYTVNDPAKARQLFAWGVTSVFSDAPDIILAITMPEARLGARQGALV
jgi:glycerophosphoryl diester phosphodiesterase